MYLMSGRDLSAQPSRPDPQPTSTAYPLSPGPLTFSVAFLSDQRDGAGFVPEDWLQQLLLGVDGEKGYRQNLRMGVKIA
jgi:hypothetical protein